MATKIISLSIPFELNEFLLNNPDLSPSKMFQAKCYEIKLNRQDLKTEIKVKDNIIKQLNEFIISKDLWNEFREWKIQK